MFAWIGENIGTIAVSLVLGGVIALIIINIKKDNKKGKKSCCGNCSMCEICGKKQKRD